MAWFDQDSPIGLVEEAVKMDRAIQKAEARVAHITQATGLTEAQIRKLQ
jgi:hypothetical protein